ncbi:MAG: pilin [Candidatus Falkowbacteria bacterium]|nr:pilin [Candidatus Falkowbacteria bacterium]
MLRSSKIHLLVFCLITLGLSYEVAFAASEPIGCCTMQNIKTTDITRTSNTTDKNCPTDKFVYKRLNWEADKTSKDPKSKCSEKTAPTKTKKGEETTFTPQVSIPGGNFNAGTAITLPSNVSAIADYIITVFKYSVGVMGIIAAIVLMFGGIRWLTAAGNQAIIGEAKKYIISSLSGLALTLGAFLLLTTINTSLTKFKVPDVSRLEYISLSTGCCEKIDNNDVKTTMNSAKDTCNSEQMPGFKSVTFKGPNYTADANECVLNIGCCIVESSETSVWIRYDTQRMCIENVKKENCDKQSSNWIKRYITSFFHSTSWSSSINLGKKCVELPNCKDQLICQNESECEKKLK